MSGDNDADASSSGGVERLEWSVSLYENEPVKRFSVIAFALIAGVVGYALFQNFIYAIIGFFAILGSTAEFWLPTRYVLDQKSARSRRGFSVTELEWSDVKRVIVSDDGVKLSPLEESNRLAPFRGVYLRFGSRRKDVLRTIKENLGNDVRFLE